MKIFKKFIFVSFLVIIFSLIIASLFPEEASDEYFYRAFWFKCLWFIVSVGIIIAFVNSVKRRDFGFSIIYLGLLLILLAGLLTSLFKEEGFMEMKKGQTQNEFWVNDNLAKPLDFSIYLKDFSVEFYPERIYLPIPLKEGYYPEERKGMRFVKSYKSQIAINREGNLVKEAVIEVNKPLIFGGYSFYQYGYDVELPEQTVLQVVKDPALPFVYAGYAVLLIGMFLSFKRAWKTI